jgi:hypothetical protein
MDPGGYPSDMECTSFDGGFAGCRVGLNPNPTWGDGVVKPHAHFTKGEVQPRIKPLTGIEEFGAGVIV